jgi:hypothetical protein
MPPRYAGIITTEGRKVNIRDDAALLIGTPDQHFPILPERHPLPVLNHQQAKLLP